MARKIEIVGATPKKIAIVDRPKRRVEPKELAAALGARPGGPQASENLDPIALGELGTQLLQRLRSSGGRPALADATVNCRVPLSADDVKALEGLASHLGASTGAKPSVGQIVSVIVRLHLNALKSARERAAADAPVPNLDDDEVSRDILRRMIDEQVTPLREQLKRLEVELHGVGADNG